MSKITMISEELDYSVFTRLHQDLGMFQVKAEIWSRVTPTDVGFDHEISEIMFVYSINGKRCKWSGFKELYEKLYGDKSFNEFERDLYTEFEGAYFKQTSYKN